MSLNPLGTISLLLLSLLLLSSVAHGFTRLDLNTHHLVAYQKPVTLVDDFIKTTVKYDFGAQMLKNIQFYKDSFVAIVQYYRTEWDPLLLSFDSLFRYVQIEPYSYTLRDMTHDDGLCTMAVGSYKDSETLASYFEALYKRNPGNGFARMWHEFISTDTKLFRFFTYEHFRIWFCVDPYIMASYLNYPDNTYVEEHVKLCKAMPPLTNGSSGPYVRQGDYQAKCGSVGFKHVRPPSKRRYRRWDASYTCGWPIISSVAKTLGGECSTNVDVSSLKQSLSAIQNFSSANTELINSVAHQLSIVNERVSLHYNQMQTLSQVISDNQVNLNTQLTLLAGRLEKDEDYYNRSISANRYAIQYSFELNRLQQSIIEFRFSYLETLDAMSKHYHFPTEHDVTLNPTISAELADLGFTVPKVEGKIPYSYSGVRYTQVEQVAFYDLEFDVFIPVVHKQQVHSDVLYASTLSPLPIQIENDKIMQNRYSGEAICDELHCRPAGVRGFCHDTPSTYFCHTSYYHTLTIPVPNYQLTVGQTRELLFIPPNTVYFPKNATYTLNDKSHTAVAGITLMLGCSDVLKSSDGRITYDMRNQLYCSSKVKNGIYVYTNITSSEPRTLKFIDVHAEEQILRYYQTHTNRLLEDLRKQVRFYKINTTQDDVLNNDLEQARVEFNAKIQELHDENIRILRRISDMKALEPSMPWILILAVIVVVIFALKFLNILV